MPQSRPQTNQRHRGEETQNTDNHTTARTQYRSPFISKILCTDPVGAWVRSPIPEKITKLYCLLAILVRISGKSQRYQARIQWQADDVQLLVAFGCSSTKKPSGSAHASTHNGYNNRQCNESTTTKSSC